MRNFFLFCSSCFLMVFSGCRTTDTTFVSTDTVYVSRNHTDTVYISRTDSAYIHDSVYIRESGDTVYYSKWHVQYKYKTDTIYNNVMNTDTVYISKSVSEVIEKEPTFLEKFMLSVKGACVLALLVLGVYCIVKYITKFRNRS